MKSFNQFLQESYLSEEPAGRSAKKRTGGPSYDEVKAEIDAKDAAKAAKKAQRGPTGAAADTTKQFKPQGTTTTVPGSNVRGGTEKAGALALRPKSGALATTQKSSDALATTQKSSGALANTPKSSTSVVDTKVEPVNVRDVTPPKGKLPSGAKPTASVGKPPTGVKPSSVVKSGGALRKLGKLAGPLGAAADVGLETMDQKSRGRKTGSALAMGATKAAGGLVGAKAGAATGAAIGSLAGPIGTAVGAGIGGVGGYLAGSGVAGKASETVAGATGKEKAAMATANRQRQAGTAVKGIGGKTTFDTKKNTITTGTGAQRKTVGLAKTGVVQRGGQSVAGNLAYKGGKAVYKAGPSSQSLAKTSSNPLERVGRSLFAGAYKKSDAANAAKKLATARQSDAARNKALGVKFGPGK
jgi:hypothetical protein